MGKKQAPGLGRALLRGGRGGRAAGAGWRHASELGDGGRAAPPQSVTEQSPLEAFLAAAELAGAAFVAEKLNVRLAPGEAAEEAGQLREREERVLRIPRRPPWDKHTTPTVLNKAERDSFLRWRRQLAWLEEEGELLLTPFERNLDFWRQLWRVLERSDVVVQIVDARNPLLFRCRDLECYATEISPEKENLILLNKADLLGEEQRSAWAQFFKKEGVQVVFWSALVEGKQLVANAKEVENVEVPDPVGKGASQREEQRTGREAEIPLGSQRESPRGEEQESDPEEDCDVYEDCEEEEEEAWLTCSEDGESRTTIEPLGRSRAETPQPGPPRGHPLRNSSRLVQRDELLEIFRSVHAGKKKVKEGELTVGLVGYPNVGKSSTINAILGKKKVSVSATPGRTKHFQTLYVEPSLCLCDCPGLVMPSFVSTKAEMICSGILPIDQMRDHVPPIALICQRIPRPVLEATYGIRIIRPREGEDPDRMPTSEELLSALGRMRGFMTDHGQPDQPRSARHVLKDYVTGKLLYCHPPPGMDPQHFQLGLERLYSSKGAAAAARNEEQWPGRDPKARQIDSTVDLAFFHQESVQALTRGTRAGAGHGAGTATHSPSGPNSANGAGKPWKRHRNRNKKQKLRRLTRHLEL
ncbi:large subunit GTPase 1 homolog [Candoia aspera]|uniref:large subunit GTPase 1 homolog n=1 Tax=Candoia aspera TaxID=51853 RepID=UPI002FD868C5